MELSSFKPHGGIRTIASQILYNNAHWTTPRKSTAKQEYHTDKLWLYILFNIYKDNPSIVVSGQQPAVDGRERADLKIEYVKDNRFATLGTLWFGESKDRQKTRPAELRKQEDEAIGYGEKLLIEDPTVEFVYCGSLVGAHIRLFRIDRKVVYALWGVSDYGLWDEYKDIGLEPEGLEIEAAFRAMVDKPPSAILGYNTSSGIGSYSGQAGGRSGYPTTAATSGYSGQAGGPSGYTVPYKTTSGQPITAAPSGYSMSAMNAASILGDSGSKYDEKGKGKEVEADDVEMEEENSFVRVRPVKTGKKHHFRYEFTDKGKTFRTVEKEWKKGTYYGEDIWLYKNKYVCPGGDIQ